jgi:ankyrin repeat protein
MATDGKRVRNEQLSASCASDSPVPSVQVKGIEAQIRAGADVRKTDKNGVTLLHHAVRFRSPAAVRALIAKGANVNQTCKRSGSTPLHRAVTSTGAPGTAGMQAEAREIVAVLLSAGADPSIPNKRGKTPGDYATDETIRALLVASPKTA